MADYSRMPTHEERAWEDARNSMFHLARTNGYTYMAVRSYEDLFVCGECASLIRAALEDLNKHMKWHRNV